MSERKLYPKVVNFELEPHYSRHVSAMTSEALHAKADIAEQLAWRDQRIEALASELAAATKRESETRVLLADANESYAVMTRSRDSEAQREAEARAELLKATALQSATAKAREELADRLAARDEELRLMKAVEVIARNARWQHPGLDAALDAVDVYRRTLRKLSREREIPGHVTGPCKLYGDDTHRAKPPVEGERASPSRYLFDTAKRNPMPTGGGERACVPADEGPPRVGDTVRHRGLEYTLDAIAIGEYPYLLKRVDTVSWRAADSFEVIRRAEQPEPPHGMFIHAGKEMPASLAEPDSDLARRVERLEAEVFKNHAGGGK